MKYLAVLLCFLWGGILTAQEQIYVYDYRKVPADEMETFYKNEAEFWSKMHAVMLKKKLITGWAMLERQYGLASEPNIYFYLGFGENVTSLDDLNEPYGEAYQEVMNSMSAADQDKMKERLKQAKFNVGVALMNRHTSSFVPDADWNYLMHNYVKATNVGQFLEVQREHFKPFFDEHMNNGNTKQRAWIVGNVIMPRGHGYSWNCYTADAFVKLSDVFDSWTLDEVPWPQDTKVGETMEGGGFYKTVLWKKVLWLDAEGNLKKAD